METGENNVFETIRERYDSIFEAEKKVAEEKVAAEKKSADAKASDTKEAEKTSKSK